MKKIVATLVILLSIFVYVLIKQYLIHQRRDFYAITYYSKSENSF